MSSKATRAPASRAISWPAAASTERHVPRREHGVEAAGGDVAERDRDRADDADPARLARRGRSSTGADPPGLGPSTPTTSSPWPGPVGARAARPSSARAGAAPGAELLAGAEVVDVAELDVGHRRARGDGDAEAVRRDRAARVERAVDRVDHDPPAGRRVAERDLAALLGDGAERVARGGERVELGEQRRPRSGGRSRARGRRPRRRPRSASARAIPRAASNTSRCASTIRRQTASQSTSRRSRAPVLAGPPRRLGSRARRPCY